ncbi:MAG: diguanylate cyclase [Opitutus sp.]|nr:diguanylate cyclase [Opitutus sp.]
MVLAEVARRVASQVRTVDRVARFGGEELVLVLVQTSRSGALDVARRVCDAVSHEPVRAGDNLALKITVSSGAAALPEDANSGPVFLNGAD